MEKMADHTGLSLNRDSFCMGMHSFVYIWFGPLRRLLNCFLGQAKRKKAVPGV